MKISIQMFVDTENLCGVKSANIIVNQQTRMGLENV